MKLKLFKINIFVISLFLFGLIIPQISSAASVGWYSPRPGILDGSYGISAPFGPYINKAACVANLSNTTAPETSCIHVTTGPRWYFFLVKPAHLVTLESRPTESACVDAVNTYNNNDISDTQSQIPTDRATSCFLVNPDIVAPSVILSAPAAGSSHPVGVPITITATVIDWGQITLARFVKNTQPVTLGEDTNTSDSTFSIQWTPSVSHIGPMTISATAYDNSGNSTDITLPNSFRNITITAQGQQVDTTPPVVTFVAPTPAENSTVVINQPVTLKVTAVDNVANVKFYVGDTLLGADLTGPSYEASWTPITTGTFIIKAEAVDTSSPAHVTSSIRNIIVGIVPNGNNGNNNSLLTISDSPTYDFGVQAIGSSTNHTFTLTNIATADFSSFGGSGLVAPFTFLGGAYPGTGGTCATTLAIGANCTIVLNYAPTTAGVQNGSLAISYNNGTAQTSSVALTGSDTVVPEEEDEEEEEVGGGITNVPIIDEPGGLIPCGTLRYGAGQTLNINGQVVDVSYQVSNPCTFNDVLHLINNVVQFILFLLVVPIAALMFAYAGFLLLTSGGEASKKTKAKSIFVNVVIGLIFAVAAWLIVSTVLSILGYDGAWIGF